MGKAMLLQTETTIFQEMYVLNTFILAGVCGINAALWWLIYLALHPAKPDEIEHEVESV